MQQTRMWELHSILGHLGLDPAEVFAGSEWHALAVETAGKRADGENPVDRAFWDATAPDGMVSRALRRADATIYLSDDGHRLHHKRLRESDRGVPLEALFDARGGSVIEQMYEGGAIRLTEPLSL